MWTRILLNWPYKIAALIIAIALKVYVSGVNDPHTSKQITVPLTLSRVPDSLVITDATPNVTLQVSGPASSLDSLTASSFSVSTDLRSVRSGVNQPLAIQVIPSPSTASDITVESRSPISASVTMDLKKTVRLPIHASFRRVAPVGVSYGAPLVMPPIASVEGPQSIVDRVVSLTIFADDAVTGDSSSPGTLDGVGTIVPLDAQQVPVQGLTILPQQAEVRVPVASEAATKDLIINANIVGAPAYPAQVQSIDVQPSRLSVIGVPSVLAQTSVISTAPVDIAGAVGDVKRLVKVEFPTGLTPVHSGDVLVIVHISGMPAKNSASGGAASLTDFPKTETRSDGSGQVKHG